MGIRTGDPRGFNKGRSWSSVKVPDYDKHLKKVGRDIDRNVVNNKDEDNSLKALNKNKQKQLGKILQI